VGAVCFRRRTPSLLQVALHTRRLQLQLRSLAELCWCCPEAAGPPAHEQPQSAILDDAEGQQQAAWELGAGQQQAAQGKRRRWQEGFPRGTDLLDYLYRRVSEAGAPPSFPHGCWWPR
jgi:hypothetical protein